MGVMKGLQYRMGRRIFNLYNIYGGINEKKADL